MQLLSSAGIILISAEGEIAHKSWVSWCSQGAPTGKARAGGRCVSPLGLQLSSFLTLNPTGICPDEATGLFFSEHS